MNTIIPNRVQFGLNLNDLPPRVAQLSYSQMLVSGSQAQCGSLLRVDAGFRLSTREDALEYCRGKCLRQPYAINTRWVLRKFKRVNNRRFGGNTSCGCVLQCY